MADFSKLKKDLSKLEQLERDINLKQLQINRLLTITQAINNNVSASGLYEMYKSFLGWEMGVKKMALFVSRGKEWTCATSIGVPEELLETDISEILPNYERMKNIEEEIDHPLISHFDLVVPVRHKDNPIAYTFIGGFEKDNDLYNKMRFITTISNIIAVAIENKRLFKDQLRQERLRTEMELAGDMQKMLVPSEFPKSEVFELSSIYIPMLGVGGDYFDFIEFEDDKFIFCIADISGKGIAAALLMANFQANFHSLIHQRTSLDNFVKDLNSSLFRITNGDKFMTLFIAEFDKKNYTLNYINAGHNLPVIAMDGYIQKLDKGCTILGAFEELRDVEIGNINIDKEAIILSYTDGLTDVRNDDGAFFDEDYLMHFAQQNELNSASLFNEKLMEEIKRFKGEQEFPDDITVLTCKIFSRE
ncbi:MAG: PP2C family protein-serine/threonine phosphatase [Saprospiraceae bacterium]